MNLWIASMASVGWSLGTHADVGFVIESQIATDIAPLSVVGLEFDAGWGIVIGLDRRFDPAQPEQTFNLLSVPSIDSPSPDDFRMYGNPRKPVDIRTHDIARNDDLADLLITNEQQSLYSWASNGDGTFDTWGDFGWSDNLTVGHAIDHEQNGRDYILLGVIKTEHRITSQAGDGDLPPQGTEKSINVETCPMDIASGDFGGDAFIDLAVANVADDSVTILINTGLDAGNNNTLTVEEFLIQDAGDSPFAIRSSEFDGQAGIDAVVLNRGDDTGAAGVTLLPAAGEVGSFSAIDFVPDSFTSADFDADSDRDLAVIGADSSGASVLAILANNGSGSFREVTRCQLPGTAVSLDVVMLQGDARPDLAVACQPMGVVILRNVVPTTLRDVTVKKGDLIAGNKRLLRGSDDKHLRASARFRPGNRRPYLLDVRTVHRTSINDPAIINIKIESRVDEPGGIAKVFLKNRNTGGWDRIRKYAVGMTEDTIFILDESASAYFDANGKAVLRITHEMSTTSDDDSFTSSFDLIELTVE